MLAIDIPYLKQLYILVYLQFFQKKYIIPTSILSPNSKRNTAFEKLYNALLERQLLENDELVCGYFFYIFSYAEKPPSVKELSTPVYIQRYIVNGISEGKRLYRNYLQTGG